MALRSLAGKLRGLLQRAVPSRTAASDLEGLGPIKLESSVEPKFQAVRKSIRDQARLRDDEEDERFMRNLYWSSGIVFVTGAVSIIGFWSSAAEAFTTAMDLMEARQRKMIAEAFNAMNAAGRQAMDAEEGEAMDVEEGKAKAGEAMDAEEGKAKAG